WDQGSPWSYNGIEGVTRFLNRVWSLLVEPAPRGAAATGAGEKAGAKAAGRSDGGASPDLRYATNLAIKNVTEDLEGFRFNTAVAELMTLQNAMAKVKAAGGTADPSWRAASRALLLMLAPIAPHIAEELWHRSGFEGSVHAAAW